MPNDAEMTVRLSGEVKAWLDDLSRTSGVPRAEIVRRALDQARLRYEAAAGGLASLKATRDGRPKAPASSDKPAPRFTTLGDVLDQAEGHRVRISPYGDHPPALVHEWVENPHFGKVCRVCKLPKGNTGPVCTGEAT